jgi:hypothetical protein
MKLLLVLLTSLNVSLNVFAKSESPGAERIRLANEIEKGCIARYEEDPKPAVVKAFCLCIKLNHRQGTSLKTLRVISDRYNDRRDFSSPNISQADTIAMDLYHDIQKRCVVSDEKSNDKKGSAE